MRLSKHYSFKVLFLTFFYAFFNSLAPSFLSYLFTLLFVSVFLVSVFRASYIFVCLSCLSFSLPFFFFFFCLNPSACLTFHFPLFPSLFLFHSISISLSTFLSPSVYVLLPSPTLYLPPTLHQPIPRSIVPSLYCNNVLTPLYCKTLRTSFATFHYRKFSGSQQDLTFLGGN